MAVESFIPVKDVKISTEKEVKQKPSISELTTIESPGKPVPASFIDKQLKKLSRKHKKPAEEKGINARGSKKDSILIITEKPQAAEKIANSLGRTSKH